MESKMLSHQIIPGGAKATMGDHGLTNLHECLIIILKLGIAIFEVSQTDL